MKQFIKLGVLGLALSMSISGCVNQKTQELLELKDDAKSMSFVLEQTHISYVYNVKEEKDLYLYAPEGYKVVVGNEKKDFYQQKIKPQEMLKLDLKIVKDGDEIKKAKKVDKIVMTFKEYIKPMNQDILTVKMGKKGKYTYIVGDANYFIAEDNEKDITLDLYEYEVGKIHEFYYFGVKNDIKFKLIAPKYSSFIFDGKPVKEYTFIAPKDKDTTINMTLKVDSGENTEPYQREYRIKLKM